MLAYRKRFENQSLTEDEGDDDDDEDIGTVSDKSKESEDSDVTENESETDSCKNESDMDQELSENEEPSTFFEHMLKNMENLDNLTENELLSQLAGSTLWFLELEKLAQSSSMLKKIEKKVQKYSTHGLNYNEAVLTVIEKEKAYFSKLVSRISADGE
jgi:hypothetical protein